MKTNEVQSLADAKKEFRRTIRIELSLLASRQRADAASKLCQRVREHEIWKRAAAILFYAPLGDELDISALIPIAYAEGKQAALPQYDPAAGLYHACGVTTPLAELPIGQFGIREPSPGAPRLELNQLDLALVPGVAFDVNGHRLGRGRGFYDRLLERFKGTKCGLGFDEQIKPLLPVEPHDVLLDCVVTPSRWFDFRRPAHPR